MRASAEPLEGNRVKLSVEVDESEIEQAVDSTYRRMAREVRVPGFRPGKVPRRLLESRLGRDTLRLEAIQDALPSYYAQALRDTEVDAIAAPEIEVTDGKEGGPIAFDAVVAVRPTVSVPGYAGLEVTLPSPAVTGEEVEAQLRRLADQQARLEPVERPARDSDHVTIDLSASRDGAAVPGLSAQDMVYEVGSSDVSPELDEALRGAKVGDILTFDAGAPDGSPAGFRVLLKQVSEKILPELDDAWASEASELSTVSELREDLRARLAELKRARARQATSEGALDALVALVADEPPDALVDAEVQERLHNLGHRLEAQRVSAREYLAAIGTDGDGLVSQMRQGAVVAVKADLALRAVAEAEGLVVTDEDVDAEVSLMAEQLGEPVRLVRERLERADRLPAVRSELRKAKALTWLVDHVGLVDEEGHPIDRSELEPIEERGGASQRDADPDAATPAP
ncbi:MAG: trigger factor [Acidimicrobiales bacterium]